MKLADLFVRLMFDAMIAPFVVLTMSIWFGLLVFLEFFFVPIAIFAIGIACALLGVLFAYLDL